MRLLLSWVTNLISMGIVIAICIFWFFVWYGNSAIYSKCFEGKQRSNYILQACADDAVRNAHYINTIFSAILIIVIIFTLGYAILDTMRNNRN